MIKEGIQEQTKPNTPGKKVTNGDALNKNTPNKRLNVPLTTMVNPTKSPSDTTIYAPALRRLDKVGMDNDNIIDKISNL